MKRIIWLVLLCTAVLVACDSPGAAVPGGPTAPPTTGDAVNVAHSFLDGWIKNDYAAMYALLSPKSLLISKEAFVGAYTKAEETLKLPENGKSYIMMDDKTERQGTTVAVHYDMKFNSKPVGEFTDANRTMRLVLTPNGWRVAWSTMDIFEGMAGGATLNLDVTQSTRGTIFDRNGKVIAQNGVPNVAVKLVTRAYPKKPEDCFSKLADVFRLRFDDLKTKYGSFTGLDYGFIIGHLSKEDADARHAELDAVCKLDYLPQVTRFYYGGGIAPQTIGYVRSIQSDDLQDYPQYSQGTILGGAGVERYWEKHLAGETGAQLIIRMPNGLQVRTLAGKTPSPSQDVTLTIDRDVQLATERALASAFSAGNWAQFSTGAAAVVIDVKTGEVLAMADYPSVDPDVFLPTTLYNPQDVLGEAQKKRALFNRATQETYALGSVFKIVSMATAADSGAFKLSQVVNCTGIFQDTESKSGIRTDWIYTDKYAEQKFHGPITLVQALTSSCDVYFWEIGKQINGIDADFWKKYGNKMGLGVKTKIDVVDEATGNIPDPAWKEANKGAKWGLGDSLNTVIGQGDVLVTPIQVARMMSGIANGGTLYHPYLVKSVGVAGQAPIYTATPAQPDSMNIDPTVIAGIQRGLCDVTRPGKIPGTKNQDLGTAHYVFWNWDFSKVSVCGKTGTAQTGLPQPNGWFAAYAGPAGGDPEIAIAVIVEHSREGSETAGPIIRRIVESYYKLPIEPWPDFWSYAYEPMADPNASDGSGYHPSH